MSRSVVSLLLAIALTAGYAKLTHRWPFSAQSDGSVMGTVSVPPSEELPIEDDTDAATAADPGQPELPALPPAVNGVRTLYDGLWTVTEGQWWLGTMGMNTDEEAMPSFTRILESFGGQAVEITAPGFYGRYRTTVELHDAPPDVPTWCEDAAEASLRMAVDPSPFQMGSFDEFTEGYALPAGSYRVRYCTEKQDVAAGQDEFTGDDYTVYAGRHLLQVWRAPQAPDRALRLGSAWARQLTHSHG